MTCEQGRSIAGQLLQQGHLDPREWQHARECAACSAQILAVAGGRSRAAVGSKAWKAVTLALGFLAAGLCGVVAAGTWRVKEAGWMTAARGEDLAGALDHIHTDLEIIGRKAGPLLHAPTPEQSGGDPGVRRRSSDGRGTDRDLQIAIRGLELVRVIDSHQSPLEYQKRVAERSPASLIIDPDDATSPGGPLRPVHEADVKFLLLVLGVSLQQLSPAELEALKVALYEPGKVDGAALLTLQKLLGRGL